MTASVAIDEHRMVVFEWWLVPSYGQAYLYV